MLTCKHSPSKGVPGICSRFCTQKSWVGLFFFFLICFCLSICFLLLWKLTCAPGNLVGAFVPRRPAGVHPSCLGWEGLWETSGCDMSYQSAVATLSGLQDPNSGPLQNSDPWRKGGELEASSCTTREHLLLFSPIFSPLFPQDVRLFQLPLHCPAPDGTAGSDI